MSKATHDTLLINAETGEYPVPLSKVFQECGNVSFPAKPLLEDLAVFGFFEVQDSERPEADVVEEAQPVLLDGVWTRAWQARKFTQEELAAELENVKLRRIGELMQLRTEEFELGIPYEMDGKLFHIQCRPEDRAILLMLKLEAATALQEGSDEVIEFRTSENESIYLKPAQMHEMLVAALKKNSAVYTKSWALRDEITAATTVEEIPELPATLF